MSIPLQAHPWHGIPARAEDAVNGYIEIVPGDTVKYEIDKASGHLKVDRPQRFSSLCPMPYGFIPRTYCGGRVAAAASARIGGSVERGDGDPLDLCVLTEMRFTHGAFLLRARPIGGLLMIDKGEADDKIVAVLIDDPAFGHLSELEQVPRPLLDRLRHYFLTYKLAPNDAIQTGGLVEIPALYGAAEAGRLIAAAEADYGEKFGG